MWITTVSPVWKASCLWKSEVRRVFLYASWCGGGGGGGGGCGSGGGSGDGVEEK